MLAMRGELSTEGRSNMAYLWRKAIKEDVIKMIIYNRFEQFSVSDIGDNCLSFMKLVTRRWLG